MNTLIRRVGMAVVCSSMLLGAGARAQQGFFTPEDVIKYTPDWHGERFPDGRPKVPDSILDRMKSLKPAIKGREPLSDLKGVAVGLFFEKPSTRTRTSFEMATFRLGGFPVYLAADDANHFLPCRIVAFEPVLRIAHAAVVEMNFSHKAASLARIVNGIFDGGAIAFFPQKQVLIRKLDFAAVAY